MAFCENCGKPLGEGGTFCTACGASANAPRTAPVVRAAEAIPPKGSPYAVISSWSYVGTFLLMALPVVGFILTIVWACGGANNHNRRNLARSYLLLLVLDIILFAVAAALLFAAGYTLDSLAELASL